MKITSIQYNIVGSWHWKIEDDTNDSCIICLLSYESPCSNCKILGKTCPLIKGKCKHIYHKHCVEKWLAEGKDECTLCRRKWEEDNSVNYNDNFSLDKFNVYNINNS